MRKMNRVATWLMQDWVTRASISATTYICKEHSSYRPFLYVQTFRKVVAFNTHVNDVGEVMDVILEDAAVGGLQSEKVLIPGFDGLQLVLRVLGLSLRIGWEKAVRNKGPTRT